MMSFQEMRVRCRGVAKDLDMIAKRAFCNIRLVFAKKNKEKSEMDRETEVILLKGESQLNPWHKRKGSGYECGCSSDVVEIEARRRSFADKYRLHGRVAGESEEAIEDHIQWTLANVPKFQLPPVAQ